MTGRQELREPTTQAEPTYEREPRERRLVVAGWLFAVGSAVHVFDHLRRGQGSISDELHWAGNLALVLQVVLVTLVVTRHRTAPLVATVGGILLAVGFFTAHWLPDWGPMSDPVWEMHSWRWLSYLASGLEIVTALVVALAGLAVLRAGDAGRAAPAATRPGS